MTDLDPRTRILGMTIRQALIMVLGAIEDWMGLPRSIVPRRKRKNDSSDDSSTEWIMDADGRRWHWIMDSDGRRWREYASISDGLTNG